MLPYMGCLNDSEGMTMDEFTRKHLHTWADNQFPYDEAEGMESLIMAFVESSDDPNYWLNQSWPRVLEAAQTVMQ